MILEKKRYYILFAALAVAIVVVFMLFRNNSMQNTELDAKSDKIVSKKSAEHVDIPENKEGAVSTPQSSDNLLKLNNLLTSAIDIWGRVVDQNGNPVKEAKVKYSIFDKVTWENPPKNHSLTDENGLFQITGTGGAVTVNVGHPEYHPEYGVTEKYLSQNSDNSNGWSKANPFVFKLVKKDEVAELIHLKKSFRVSKDGKPITIDLKTDERGSGSAEITFFANTEAPSTPSGKKYRWAYTLKVNDGGLVEREDKYNFLAPESGYRNQASVIMDPNTEKIGNQVILKSIL